MQTGAAAADAPYLDLGDEHAAQSPDGVRDAERVEVRAHEIPRQAATGADVVVVVVQVRVEANAFAPRPERRDEPQVVEHPERAVDGVNRQRRHPFADSAEHGVRVRVLQARGDFAEDLEALVCELDARGPDGRLESVDPPVDGRTVDRIHISFLFTNHPHLGM